MKRTINFRIVLALGLGLTLAALCLSLNPGSALSKAPAAELHVCPVGCPYSSVQAAVDAANEGDTIKVATGVYTDVSAREGVTQTVYISKSITIQGGYTVTDWTTPYPITQPTTLDAQGQGRVLYITGNISPTIEGLRITGGNAAGLGGYTNQWGTFDAGGGVYVIAATVTLSSNQLFSNTANVGGGQYLEASTASLDDNIISHNNAHSLGGGLVLNLSNSTVLNGNTISYNTAQYGGGVYLDHSDHVTLTRNTVSSNTPQFCGGGLYLEFSHQVLLARNMFATNATMSGGGLYLDWSDATLDSNIISDNSASTDGGGGLYLQSSTAQLVNNLITDNRTNSYGSGLVLWASQSYLLHTSFIHNTGGDGSGIYLHDDWWASSIITLANTILVSHTIGITVTANNMATLNGILWFGNATNTSGDGAISITHAITGNPAFAADGYHLTTASAAIDQGVDAGVTTDIDGQVRPIGLAPDLGADEFQPPTRYVTTSGVDTGDCSNSAAPCRTVQYAVDVADEGNAIKVATGVYTDVSVRPRNDVTTTGVVTQVVYISKTVTIQGSYAITDWTTPNPTIYPTTLDARRQGRVLYIAGNISPTIAGLRTTGGDAAGLGGAVWQNRDAGGAVYIVWAAVTFINNMVFDNLAADGGGLYLHESSAMLSSNNVSDNTADRGGGLYLYASDAIHASNIVTANTANFGGGLYLNSCTATLSDNIIASNSATYGGGLYLYTSPATLNNNVIANNQATSENPDALQCGGGLYIWSSSATLNGNIVTFNSARTGGGVCLYWYSNALLTNNVIAENRIRNVGSGLYIGAASPLMLHTTIVHNTGGDSSGVYVATGGQIYSNLTMSNTILVSHTIGVNAAAGNSATLNGVLWFDNGTNTGGDGLITVTNAITGDPAFAPDGYHLTATSTAIDRGIDAGVTTDIDGDLRPTGFGFDLGADEFPAGLIVTKQATPDPVQSGAQLTYTILATNNDIVDLHATITDTLPAHVTPGGILTWTPTITAPGGVWSQLVIVTVELGYTGTLTNNVQVTTIEGATGSDNVAVQAHGYRIYLPLVLRQSP
jgi:hypothetical protein